MSKSISGITTQFLYDGLNPVQEQNSSSGVANLLTGLNIDEYFTRADSSNNVSTLLADALGSTIGLVGSAQTITTNYTYQPFGATTVGGSANGNSYEFTGRENDGTGLYFYRARYYSPAFQRFLSQDRIDFNSGTANLYEYVGSSPIMSDDPSGMLGPITALTGAIGGGIAGGAGAALSGGGGWAIATGVFGGIMTGGVVGFFDPGPLVASFVGAGAGVLGDIATQLATAGPFSWSQLVGAGVGGAATGALVGLTGEFGVENRVSDWGIGGTEGAITGLFGPLGPALGHGLLPPGNPQPCQ